MHHAVIKMTADNEEKERFHADPLLPALLAKEQDDFFSLGLVVNWPFNFINNDKTVIHDKMSVWRRHYESFLDAVKQECFSDCCDEKDLYWTPLHSLHITVATLVPATRLSDLPAITNDNVSSADEWKSTVIQQWKEVLWHASLLQSWPGSSDQHSIVTLHLESAQIAPRAAILLWEECSALNNIRKCLRQSVQLLYPHLLPLLRIPNIIHTTFVRYRQESFTRFSPSQCNQILNEKIVKSHSLFGTICESGNLSSTSKSQSVVIDNVKLVNCKIYMQGDDPQDHPVYLTMPVGLQQVNVYNNEVRELPTILDDKTIP
jgi:hypothetical protein